jgi:dephospho-CoA kinase
VGKAGTKPIIGILGGIGSGKSTVAAEFAKLDCAVIDADKIAHELLDRKDIKDRIVSLFGQAVLDSANKVDSRKLADIVFTDANKLASLNKIIHPFVLARIEELIKQYQVEVGAVREPPVQAIVLDMPLLAEVGWAERCDKLIFVDCKRQLRVDRAKKLCFFDENKLKIRENFQISLDNKVTISDNTIDNNSGFSALAKQVTDIFSGIKDKWGLS